MRKSSKSISLALIGSAFLVGGCGGPALDESESEWSTDGDGIVQTGASPNEQAIATGTDQYHHGQNIHHSGGRMASGIAGGIIGSQIGRAMGGGSAVAPGYGGRPGTSGGMAASPSARGGFGSSAGHASSGGHASSSS